MHFFLGSGMMRNVTTFREALVFRGSFNHTFSAYFTYLLCIYCGWDE
jgi:hypothetical protein